MKSSAQLPSALDEIDHLLAKDDRLAVFLDYDGTLTPIVSRPEDAILSDAMRERVRRLATKRPVVLVSGRGRRNVAELVGIDGLGYVGSHGFDIVGPEGSGVAHEVAADALPLLDDAEAELRETTADIPGSLVERKRFGVAVHYRLVADGAIPRVEEAVTAALAKRQGLQRAEGKKVFELRPDVDWDKGKAVLWLLDALGLDDAHPIHLGDDLTDETVFTAIRDRGTGVFVGRDDRPTAAAWRLDDPGQVGRLLDRLTPD